MRIKLTGETARAYVRELGGSLELAHDSEGLPYFMADDQHPDHEAMLARIGAEAAAIAKAAGRLNTFPASSPWGPIELRTQAAPGIVSVSTARHGGIWLSFDRWQSLPEVLKRAPTFCGDPQWFEEDADWIVPVLAFPDAFDPEACAQAVRAAMAPREYVLAQACRLFLADEASRPVRERAALFEAERTQAGKWQRGTCCSVLSGWRVTLIRGMSGRTVTFKQYPTQEWYTDEEIEALRLHEGPRQQEGPSLAAPLAGCKPLPKIAPLPGLDPDPRPTMTGQEVIDATRFFDESQCGGVFDGHQVTSDADPGL